MTGDDDFVFSCHFEKRLFFLGGISGILEVGGGDARAMWGGLIDAGDGVLCSRGGNDGTAPAFSLAALAGGGTVRCGD
jgi:hypothetical protein